MNMLVSRRRTPTEPRISEDSKNASDLRCRFFSGAVRVCATLRLRFATALNRSTVLPCIAIRPQRFDVATVIEIIEHLERSVGALAREYDCLPVALVKEFVEGRIAGSEEHR
jgi:hypothetical protein